MKRKRHLTLVQSPNNPSTQYESFRITSLDADAEKEHLSIEKRLFCMEGELAAIRHVMDASLSVIRSLPVGLLKTYDLADLRQMFSSSPRILDLYDMELSHLATFRLSTREIRQYTRIRNILNYMRAGLPETAESIVALTRKVEQLKTRNYSGESLQTKLKKARQSCKSSSGKKFIPLTGNPCGLQLKVVVQGTRPSVWRRLLVPGDCSLAELHFIIQQSMGWSNKHLHCFYIEGENYSSQYDEANTEARTLQDFNVRKGSKFEYIYDLEDNWIHTVEVEKVLDSSHNVLECIDGRQPCPAERD